VNIRQKVLANIYKIIKEDRTNVGYLFSYSFIEAILVLSIPLATSLIINSVLAHTSISLFMIGVIVTVIFFMTTFLQIMKEYIVEKFQQKIFVQTGIEIANMAAKINPSKHKDAVENPIDKLMNYFFDITAIQKIFPLLLLDGASLVIKMVVSLVLLLLFDPYLFGFGLLFFVLFIVVLIFFGTNGMELAVARSDAKHKSIYYLQHIPEIEEEKAKRLEKFDTYLQEFVQARTNIFKVIIRQLSWTFLIEGLIFTGFLMLGGYLVINGKLPVGEFVAAEIVIVSITYAIKSFVKQIDYIYDMVEGIYKVDKLADSLAKDIA
jgi:ABC-type bacteriocin/lantibiotic exporter with double-glycine peptidase domain